MGRETWVLGTLDILNVLNRETRLARVPGVLPLSHIGYTVSVFARHAIVFTWLHEFALHYLGV